MNAVSILRLECLSGITFEELLLFEVGWSLLGVVKSTNMSVAPEYYGELNYQGQLKIVVAVRV